MAANRPNFLFACNVLVQRVIFDERKIAIGVEIMAPNKKICTIQAKREVILSL